MRVRVIFLFLISFIFISCNNNFNSSDLREMIEEIIRIENGPLVELKFESNQGKLSIQGKYGTKVGKKFFISFIPDSEYAFDQWKVKYINSNTYLSPEEQNEIIYFENLKSEETEVKLLKETENLLIVPICKSRPYIISKSPEYNDNGVYRNFRIRIVFDRPMSANSFFYSENEIETLKENGISNFLMDSENRNSYGYINSNEEIYFKNIEIFNKNDSSENLLKYFDCPYIDPFDNTIINIPQKINNEDLIPSGKVILVSLNKDFCDTENIKMSSSIKWNFFTNSSKNESGPQFESLSFIDGDYEIDTQYLLQYGTYGWTTANQSLKYNFSLLESASGFKDISMKACLVQDYDKPTYINFDAESNDCSKDDYGRLLSNKEIELKPSLQNYGKKIFAEGELSFDRPGLWYVYITVIDRMNNFTSKCLIVEYINIQDKDIWKNQYFTYDPYAVSDSQDFNQWFVFGLPSHISSLILNSEPFVLRVTLGENDSNYIYELFDEKKVYDEENLKYSSVSDLFRIVIEEEQQIFSRFNLSFMRKAYNYINNLKEDTSNFNDESEYISYILRNREYLVGNILYKNIKNKIQIHDIPFDYGWDKYNGDTPTSLKLENGFNSEQNIFAIPESEDVENIKIELCYKDQVSAPLYLKNPNVK